jgi:hypothetical protein
MSAKFLRAPGQGERVTGRLWAPSVAARTSRLPHNPRGNIGRRSWDHPLKEEPRTPYSRRNAIGGSLEQSLPNAIEMGRTRNRSKRPWQEIENADWARKGPIAMSAKEWRLHCQVPHTETNSYLRTSRATFIFDALRRTGWLGQQDSNLCILESEFARLSARWGGTRTCASRIKARSTPKLVEADEVQQI